MALACGSAGAIPAAAPSSAVSCAELAEPQRRLDCYDARFPPVAGAARLLDRSASSARAEREFGLDRRQLAQRRPDLPDTGFPDRIRSVVGSVTVRSDGLRVVRLQNGQVWVLTEAGAHGRVHPHQAVEIRKAALGSFMLITDGGVALRARRLH